MDVLIDEIQRGLHDKALDSLDRAIQNRRRAITPVIKPGDIVRFGPRTNPKYLAGKDARVLKLGHKNLTVELLDKTITGVYARGPFGCPPSMVTLVSDGNTDADIDSFVVQDKLDGCLTMRDFRVGDKVRTAANVRPAYIANQLGTVKSVRRTRILVVFDNPPSGRFRNGVVIKPDRLTKV
jgi:hypothetical protein